MAITVSHNQKSYDFSSVGELTTEVEKFVLSEEDSPPIGIKTPIAIEENLDDFLVMHRDLASQVKDNFKNLLLTNHGERLLMSNFGANLKPLAFELQSEGGISAALRRVKSATEKFMPFINLLTFTPLELRNDDSSVAKIGARITYSVPSANIKEQAIEIVLYSVA